MKSKENKRSGVSQSNKQQQPEGIEKQKTSTQFQENEPEVPNKKSGKFQEDEKREKASSQNPENENDETEGNQEGDLENYKDPHSQTEEDKISEVKEDGESEDEEKELSKTTTGENSEEPEPSKTSTSDDDSEPEPSQSRIDEDEDEEKPRSFQSTVEEGIEQASEAASIHSKILPSISSAGIVVEEQRALEQPSADDAFSRFSDVLLVEEKNRSSKEPLEHLIPLEHQDFEFTVLQTEEDIKEYFQGAIKDLVKKPSTKLHQKSSMKLDPKPSTRLSRLRAPELKEDEPKKESPSKLVASGQSPTPRELCSEWQPNKDEPKVGYHYRYQSWVGDYILGYDYWTPEADEVDEHVKEVRFNIDVGQKWYDRSMNKAQISKSTIDEKRDVSMKKIEALKVKAPTDIKRGERKLPVAYNPWEPVDEKLKYDLRDMFNEFAKQDTSTAKNRMSLKNADKWLEKVGLLDHKHLTLIHTGLCFRASGGSRYRGLTFEEFFTFVEMISNTRNIPLEHAINRLKYAVLDIAMSERMS